VTPKKKLAAGAGVLALVGVAGDADKAEWMRERNRQAMAFGMGAAAICAVDAGLTKIKWLAVCEEGWKWAKKIRRREK
jgi:hypothetical protein